MRLLPAEEKPHTLVKVVCNLVEQLRQDIFPYSLELTVSSPESPPASMESAPSHNSNSVKLSLGKFEVISNQNRADAGRQSSQHRETTIELPVHDPPLPWGDVCLPILSGDVKYGKHLDEEDDAWLLPPTDGDGTVKYNFELLYELFMDLNPKRIFVGDSPDLCDPRITVSAILEYLRVVEAARWHTFQWLTPRVHRLREIQSDWLSKHSRFPENLSLGLRIESPYHIEKMLEAFNECRAERRFLALFPFRSDRYQPLSRHGDSLCQLIKKLRLPWLIFGGSTDVSGRSSLTSADAKYIVGTFQDAGTRIFYTTENSEGAFEQDGKPKLTGTRDSPGTQTRKTVMTPFEALRELPVYAQNSVCDVSGFVRKFSGAEVFGPGRAAAWVSSVAPRKMA